MKVAWEFLCVKGCLKRKNTIFFVNLSKPAPNKAD